MKQTRIFYRRLGHKPYGVTELAVIDPNGKGMIATGFFASEDAFVRACEKYNGKYNIYAGRNPRPRWLPKACMDHLDTRYKQRAKDRDIQYITAISLDIDPIRPKGTSSTDEQHRKAIGFALCLGREIGGWVDDSGNGSYLWIPFENPIRITNKNRDQMKQKCRIWQENIAKAHKPEHFGLRIDGCYDLSRLKKVIGTVSVKGKIHRQSRFIREDKADDKVRDAILGIHLPEIHYCRIPSPNIRPSYDIPRRFLTLLRNHQSIRRLWLTPGQDTSSHDWILGSELVKLGFQPQHIARILMLNPFGKYQRDRRIDYLNTTVNKLTGEASGT